MADPQSRGFLDQLLALSVRAEEIGNYETAYHVLMGALHDAEHRGDAAAVEEIAKLASEQEGRLEAIDPPHKLSSAAALLRGTPTVYRTLQLHADAVGARLRHQPG